MKIRTGFVSNSSSASFTIIWQILDEKQYTSNEAIDALFDFDGGRQEVMNDIKKHTKSLGGKNIFETYFYITMFNSFGDFGNGAEALLLHLYGRNLTDRCDPSTAIIKSHIQSEGGW
jgi:hypothetical protein